MSGESEADGWACAVCTYLNPSQNGVCDVCGSASLGGASIVVEEVLGQWICDSCTFRNEDARRICEMCATRKPGLPDDEAEHAPEAPVVSGHGDRPPGRRTSSTRTFNTYKRAHIHTEGHAEMERQAAGLFVDDGADVALYIDTFSPFFPSPHIPCRDFLGPTDVAKPPLDSSHSATQGVSLVDVSVIRQLLHLWRRDLSSPLLSASILSLLLSAPLSDAQWVNLGTDIAESTATVLTHMLLGRKHDNIETTCDWLAKCLQAALPSSTTTNPLSFRTALLSSGVLVFSLSLLSRLSSPAPLLSDALTSLVSSITGKHTSIQACIHAAARILSSTKSNMVSGYAEEGNLLSVLSPLLSPPLPSHPSNSTTHPSETMAQLSGVTPDESDILEVFQALETPALTRLSSFRALLEATMQPAGAPDAICISSIHTITSSVDDPRESSTRVLLDILGSPPWMTAFELSVSGIMPVLAQALETFPEAVKERLEKDIDTCIAWRRLFECVSVQAMQTRAASHAPAAPLRFQLQLQASDPVHALDDASFLPMVDESTRMLFQRLLSTHNNAALPDTLVVDRFATFEDVLSTLTSTLSARLAEIMAVLDFHVTQATKKKGRAEDAASPATGSKSSKVISSTSSSGYTSASGPKPVASGSVAKSARVPPRFPCPLCAQIPWMCLSCTYENAGGRTTCEICSVEAVEVKPSMDVPEMLAHAPTHAHAGDGPDTSTSFFCRFCMTPVVDSFVAHLQQHATKASSPLSPPLSSPPREGAMPIFDFGGFKPPVPDANMIASLASLIRHSEEGMPWKAASPLPSPLPSPATSPHPDAPTTAPVPAPGRGWGTPTPAEQPGYPIPPEASGYGRVSGRRESESLPSVYPPLSHPLANPGGQAPPPAPVPYAPRQHSIPYQYGYRGISRSNRDPLETLTRPQNTTRWVLKENQPHSNSLNDMDVTAPEGRRQPWLRVRSNDSRKYLFPFPGAGGRGLEGYAGLPGHGRGPEGYGGGQRPEGKLHTCYSLYIYV
jgi:hypothetical protein